MDFIEWFFKETGRTPEGLFSFAHLFSVTLGLAIFLGLAVLLAKIVKTDEKKQTKVLIGAGIGIVVVFIIKMTYIILTSLDSPIGDVIVGNLPLYLCDMQIFVIPLAALTKGRFRKSCLDFVAIWGLLMGFFGTYFAGNIYGAHCAFSFFAIIGLLEHTISAFAALFIFLCGLNTMEYKNMPFSVGILVIYMTTALVIDYADNHNFMFFFHGDGTPFDFFRNLVNDIKPLYQLEIYILQCGYMVGFYFAYHGIVKWINNAKKKKEMEKANTEIVKEGE